MMSVHPLTQAAQSGTNWQSATNWPWLSSAADMAAQTCIRLTSPVPRGTPEQASFPRVATRTFGSDLAAVATARDFTRAALQRWGAGGRCDDITLVVSELLSNALRHAPPRPGDAPVRLGLVHRAGRPVLCAIADSSPAPPRPAPPDHLAETGRGLQVVQELSDGWGWGYVTPDHTGKVVWAAFASADPSSRP